MKRGKKFFENENLLIYVGTAIFFILAIAIGIIMYMTTNTNKTENFGTATEQEIEVEQQTESVSTEIGKTVEEQQNNTIPTNTVNENTTVEKENTTKTNATNTTKNNVVTENTNKTENSNTTTPEPQVTETKKEITFVKPTEGEIICEYAKENLIYSETLKEWITHTAIDIKADKTSVIKSAAAGIVKSIVNDPRYGLTVVIEHDDGYETVYSNLLTAEFVVEGEEVEQGQTIGTVGNTAAFESSMECHLHFELLKDGEYLDPSIYLK